MAKIAGIQFQNHGKAFNYDVGALQVSVGDYVIVDTGRGLDLGRVATDIRETEEDSGAQQLNRVVRIATEEDIQYAAQNREREQEAFRICQKKIAEHRLEMKLVSVEYAFDGNKILFYFTANGRVDFRSLVKDLASVFKTRIELRQIGVRDEARMLGGLGPCGRQICCGSFLEEFQPVSIRMAKDQNLSLNPTKISGVCGRLMCCLKYEQDHYEQTRKKMPRMGREVITPSGAGTVCDLNIVKETVSVRIMNGDSSEIREFPLEQISRPEGNGSRPARIPEETTDIEEETEEILMLEEQEEELMETETVEDERVEIAVSSREGADSPRASTRGSGRKPRSPLGQPVKRENPNRANPPQGGQKAEGKPPKGDRRPPAREKRLQDNPAQTASKSQPDRKPPVQERRPPKKQSWKEAVQSAMESMEQ